MTSESEKQIKFILNLKERELKIKMFLMPWKQLIEDYF